MHRRLQDRRIPLVTGDNSTKLLQILDLAQRHALYTAARFRWSPSCSHSSESCNSAWIAGGRSSTSYPGGSVISNVSVSPLRSLSRHLHGGISRCGIAGLRTLRGPTGRDLEPAPPRWEGACRISSVTVCVTCRCGQYRPPPPINSPRGPLAARAANRVPRNFYPPASDLRHNPAAQGQHRQPSSRTGRIQ
jgi:hypothetical protein